jgi:outer membrane protein assembly factor BamB
VIDLDLSVPGEPPRPRPGGNRRRALAAALLALVLLTTAAAAAPPAPGLVPVRTAPGGTGATYRVFDDTLYVVEDRPDGDRLTAYPLPAGPPRWSTPLDLTTANSRISAMGDVVLVSMYLPSDGDHTVALDRATGTVRWRSLRSLIGLDRLRGRVLLAQFSAAGAETGEPGADVVAVSTADGTEAWRYHRDGGCQTSVTFQVTRPESVLATLCEDGTLESVDLATGRPRATIALAETVGIVGVGFGATLASLAGRIVLSVPGPQRAAVTAYDPDRLRALWRTPVEPGRYAITECGPRICLVNVGAVKGLDPATGAIAWQQSAGGFSVPLGDRYVLVAPAVLGEERLVDAVTGDRVLALDRWTGITFGTAAIFFRADPATHRTWAAVLSTHPVGLRLLGAVAGIDTDSCLSTDRYLVCRTVVGTLQVWRLDTPG